jgi:DNA-binding transcriptional MerR regulator
MDIAEVCRRSGLPASTLRFYEEKGLIVSVGRRGLRRIFNSSVLERLALIALGRATGFSLDEIALMFGPIRELAAMRDSLRHAAACPAGSHMQCPTFRRLLRAAATGAIGRQRRKI